MQKGIKISLAVCLLSCGQLLANDSAEGDKEAIMKTVEEAYVKGIQINQDPVAIRKGLHEDFIMFVKQEGKITQVAREAWIARIEESKAKNPNRRKPKVDHNFLFVDVVGNAAALKIEIHKDGQHVFTDYMSLYKFEDGWKIIGKIFQRHR
jgi:hypothetical protein